MRSRLYIVVCVAIVLETMVMHYVPTFAGDKNTPQDKIHLQIDSTSVNGGTTPTIVSEASKQTKKLAQKNHLSNKQKANAENNKLYSKHTHNIEDIAEILKSIDSSAKSIDSSLRIASDSARAVSSSDIKDSDIISAQEISGLEKAILYTNAWSKKYLEEKVPEILSEWSFPLIIMLFAFGFPFIFNAITKLEEKYHSEELSADITTSRTYKFYKISLFVAVLCSILYCSRFVLPVVNSSWICGFEYTIKIIGVGVIHLSAILLVVSTTLIVRYLFLYNDANKIFERWNNSWKIDNEDNKTTQIIFSLYDYALRQEKKDLLNAIETKFNILLDNYRNTCAPEKFNNRYEVNYPKSLLESIRSLYENVLKTSNTQYQNRVAQLYCNVLYDRVTLSSHLPRTILGEATLKEIWETIKLTTQHKAEPAFTILWSNLVEYYGLLLWDSSEKQSLNNEKEQILDLCFIIGAFNYLKKASANLQYINIYSTRGHQNDDMSFSQVDDVLYRYYHCTNDATSQVDKYNLACDTYKIYDYDMPVKKTQIAPLTQYAVVLLLSIYNQTQDDLLFDPIALRKRLSLNNPTKYHPRPNLIEILKQKSINTIDKSVFSITKKVSEADLNVFAQCLMTNTEEAENMRLYRVKISDSWKREFEHRIEIIVKVKNTYLNKLIRFVREKEINGYGQGRINFTGSSSLPAENPVYANPENIVTTTQIEEQNDVITDKFWDIPCSIRTNKAKYVYKKKSLLPDNAYNDADTLGASIYQLNSKRLASLFFSMKKGNTTWAKTREELSAKLKVETAGKDIIIYITSEKSKEDSTTPIEVLKKEKEYSYENGQSAFNGIPIYVIEGEVLDVEMRKNLCQSFIAMKRDDLPIMYSDTDLRDSNTYTISYEDDYQSNTALLIIAISTNALMSYRMNTCKFIRCKFNI